VDGRVESNDVVRTAHHVNRLGILVFKGLIARRLYMSFGVKGLINMQMPISHKKDENVRQNFERRYQPRGVVVRTSDY
jgi:hypothetical protein